MAQSIVRVAAGLVRGEPAGGAVVFRGIPHAAALAGPDRFRPPQPARPGEGTRDATRSGPTAPEGSYPAFARSLFNAWTPGPAACGVPVLAWTHGGSFTNGAGSLPASARHSEVTIEHVSLRAAVGGYATPCAVST